MSTMHASESVFKEYLNTASSKIKKRLKLPFYEKIAMPIMVGAVVPIVTTVFDSFEEQIPCDQQMNVLYIYLMMSLGAHLTKEMPYDSQHLLLSQAMHQVVTLGLKVSCCTNKTYKDFDTRAFLVLKNAMLCATTTLLASRAYGEMSKGSIELEIKRLNNENKGIEKENKRLEKKIAKNDKKLINLSAIEVKELTYEQMQIQGLERIRVRALSDEVALEYVDPSRLPIKNWHELG